MTNRTRSRCVAALTALCLLLPAVLVAPVSGEPVDDLRAEARQIAEELDRLSGAIGLLNEEYNQAQIRLDEVRRRQADTQTRVAAAEAELATRRAQLAGYAVSSYVSGDTTQDLADVLLHGSGPEAARRIEYLRLASADRQQLIDRVRAAKLVADRELEGLRRDHDEGEALQRTLVDKKTRAEAHLAEQQALLERVNGELAVLVDQENQRRAAEAYARATGVGTEAAVAAVTGGVPLGPPAAGAPAPLAPTAPPPAAGPGTTPPTTPTPTAPPPPGPVAPSPPVTTVPAPTPAPAPTTTAPRPAPTTPPPPPTTPPTTAPAPGPPPPVSTGAARAVAAAQTQLGVPYVWGGSTPGVGFDCSGLTSWAWRQAGRSLPHSAQMQFDVTRRVAIDQLQPGDLVFYQSPVIGHVGMYVGAGTMIEAPRTGLTVRYSSIYRTSLVGAGRP